MLANIKRIAGEHRTGDFGECVVSENLAMKRIRVKGAE